MCGCDGSGMHGTIALQLDHIDGDGSNNELSNLRFLCPNCHATTETYAGRNIVLKRQGFDFKTYKQKRHDKEACYDLCPTCKKNLKHESSSECSACHKLRQKASVPKTEEIIHKLNELESIAAVARYYGVTEGAVRYWCKTREITLPSKR